MHFKVTLFIFSVITACRMKTIASTFRKNSMLNKNEIKKLTKEPIASELMEDYSLNYENYLIIQDGSYAKDHCAVNEDDSLALKSEEHPLFMWFGPDSNTKEVDKTVFRAYENGEMEIVKPRWWHTGLYVCHVTSKIDHRFSLRFRRFYAVIFNPEYLNQIYFYFDQSECEEESATRVLDLMLRTFCRGEPNCIYKIRSDSCLWNSQSQMYQSRFTVIQQVPKTVYEDLGDNCGVMCKHQKSITALNAHLEPLMDTMLQNLHLAYSKDNYKMRFWDHEVYLESICPEGFEMVDDVLCRPCGRGYFENNFTRLCLSCGVFSYQDMIASKICKSCGWLRLTACFGAQEIEQCIRFYESFISLALVVLLTVLIALLFYFCIVCCCISCFPILSCIFCLNCIRSIIVRLIYPTKKKPKANVMTRKDDYGYDEERKLLLE